MTDGQDFNDDLDLPDELLTPSEIYWIDCEDERRRHIEAMKDLEKELQERQKTCKHEFGELQQIGWVPDVEIMGYTCWRCDLSVRELPKKSKRTWIEWFLGNKNVKQK